MAAEEQEAPESSPKKSGSMMKMVIWLVVVVVSIGGGFATPLLIAQLTAPSEKPDKPMVPEVDPNEEVEYIDFDEVVAVLGKSKLTRYLKMNLSLQVAKSQRSMVEKKLTAKNAVIKNRILSHLAEISEEEIAGTHGHNQLRRQLNGFFNEILFEDGIEYIQDVFFREFNVQ